MSEELVHADTAILLVGGGALGSGEVARVSGLYHGVVAADGGADAALAHGLIPDHVIGDLDSISEAARARAGHLHPVAEQDSTDFEKCLTRISAPLVLGLGFLGRRVDHELAALATLARLEAPRCILVGTHDVVARVPARLALELEAGTRVSLFPMGAARGTSRGLAWPLDGLTLAPDGQIATSNAATGPVTLLMEGACLILLPPEALPALITGLAEAP